MAFEFNNIGTFKPKVENTFLGKGGGGGNTGYFRQRKKKKDEDISIMQISLDEDTLIKPPSFELEEINGNDLISKVKNFFKK